MAEEPTIWERLAEPFPPEKISWRIQSTAKPENKFVKWVMIIPYIDGRDVMNRLDSILGPAGWKDEYRTEITLDIPGAICRLSIFDGENWIAKEDGADARSNKGGESMQFKGLLSDALKRAAVKFGIGRQLYDMDPVYIDGGDIKPGYPPKDGSGIRLYAKDKVNGWCERPNVNGKKMATNKKSTKKETKPEADPEDATTGQYNAIKILSQTKNLEGSDDLKNRVDDFLNSDVREYIVASRLIGELNELKAATKTHSIKEQLKAGNV